MPSGPDIILALKILVVAVSVLLAASLVAIAGGRRKLHGRINTAFLILTLTTVAGFELLLQFVDVKSAFDEATREALRVHLWFSIPSAVVLPAMYLTGRAGRRSLHLGLGFAFLVLWTGTLVSGVFFLPHG